MVTDIGQSLFRMITALMILSACLLRQLRQAGPRIDEALPEYYNSPQLAQRDTSGASRNGRSINLTMQKVSLTTKLTSNGNPLL